MLAVYFDYGACSELKAVFAGDDYPNEEVMKGLWIAASKDRAKLSESIIEDSDIARRVEVSELVARF